MRIFVHVWPEKWENEWDSGFAEGGFILRKSLFDASCIRGSMDEQVDEFTTKLSQARTLSNRQCFASDKYWEWPVLRVTIIASDKYCEWPVLGVTSIGSDKYCESQVLRVTSIASDQFCEWQVWELLL